MPAIETELLTRSYGRAHGIRDLDLVVPEGSVFGFLASEWGGQDNHDPGPARLPAPHVGAGQGAGTRLAP